MVHHGLDQPRYFSSFRLNYVFFNVVLQVQKKNPQSPLEIYRKLARLRKQPVFQTGEFDTAIANEDIYSFIRFSRNRPVYLTAINFGTKVSTDNYRKYSGKVARHTTQATWDKFVPDEGTVVLNTQNFEHNQYDIGAIIDLESITLAPGQGLVIKFWAGY